MVTIHRTRNEQAPGVVIGSWVLAAASGLFFLTKCVWPLLQYHIANEDLRAGICSTFVGLAALLLLVGVIVLVRARAPGSGLGRQLLGIACIGCAGALVSIEVAAASFWFWGHEAHGAARFGWYLNLRGLIGATYLVLISGGAVWVRRLARQRAMRGLPSIVFCLFGATAIMPLLDVLYECGRLSSIGELILLRLLVPSVLVRALEITTFVAMAVFWAFLAIAAHRWAALAPAPESDTRAFPVEPGN